ncbi:MAG TPA: DUF5955 family protein [Streptosporangiaceae bacterium]
MSKEKFEVAFMAGGLMLDALGRRLRRRSTTPREAVGEAMHELTTCLRENHAALADPDAAEQSLAAVRAELCESPPDMATVTEHLDLLRIQAGSDVAVAEAITALYDAVDAWLESAETG